MGRKDVPSLLELSSPGDSLETNSPVLFDMVLERFEAVSLSRYSLRPCNATIQRCSQKGLLCETQVLIDVDHFKNQNVKLL